MWKKAFLILAITSLMAVNANAQSMILGPELGYYKVPDADNGSYLFGVAWRMKILPVLGIEASINYRQEKYGNDARRMAKSGAQCSTPPQTTASFVARGGLRSR